MILSDVLTLLKQRGGASLDEIAVAVDAPSDAVELMLDTLQRRRLVNRVLPSPGCGSSCNHCAQKPTAIYMPAKSTAKTAEPQSSQECVLTLPGRQ